MEYNGQGAIEYLLIIAAAVLIVAVVIIAVTGVLTGGQDQGDSAATTQQNAMSALDIQRRLTIGEIELTAPKNSDWENGKTYFVSQDITATTGAALAITGAEEVTIDCINHTLTTLTEAQAVVVSNSSDITIQNCRMENSGTGITALNSNNLIITNSFIMNNSNQGIFILGTPTVTIDNSELCSNVKDLVCWSPATITTTGSKIGLQSGSCTINGSFESCS